jgi:hypothetical protein
MDNFKILMPNGNVINQTTILNGGKLVLDSEEKLCKFIKSLWCKETGSKGFQEWADALNETGDYEGKFFKQDGLDNLASTYTLNINDKSVSLVDFFNFFYPFKDERGINGVVCINDESYQVAMFYAPIGNALKELKAQMKTMISHKTLWGTISFCGYEARYKFINGEPTLYMFFQTC